MQDAGADGFGAGAIAVGCFGVGSVSAGGVNASGIGADDVGAVGICGGGGPVVSEQEPVASDLAAFEPVASDSAVSVVQEALCRGEREQHQQGAKWVGRGAWERGKRENRRQARMEANCRRWSNDRAMEGGVNNAGVKH